MKIGRYEIKFGKYYWVQTRAPTIVRRFLCFWILKETEARPEDVDKEPKFKPGTRMDYEGRTHWYVRAGKDIQPGEGVNE